jgi:hypothetical protein
MFGMRKGLKYIKVVGTIQSMQEDYKHVVIRDEAGQELKFDALILPTRLHSEIEVATPSVFYFLRAKTGSKMIAALYALEKGGQKIYFDEEAAGICKAFARQLSNRYQFLRDDKIRLVYLAICLGIMAIIFNSIASVGQYSILRFITQPLGLVLAGTFGFYSWYPLVMGGSYAGISQIKPIMDAEGFKAKSFSNSKY